MVKFDVFLCHNSQDKPEVIEIARQLQQQGLKPWLDVWELPPGQSWQELLEDQIKDVKSAAVFIGSSGLGPWQDREMRALLSEFVRRNCPVIPVMLESAPQKPQLPIFLNALTWVDFKSPYLDPMEQLIFGITGVKPKKLEHRPSTSGPPSEAPAPPLTEPKLEEVELKSEKCIDYTKLRDLLAAEKWKEADQETGKVMLHAAGSERKEYMSPKQIESFPCIDLRTINQLWLHYSHGQFGFSVQKEIYESLGGAKKDWKDFCACIGWVVKYDGNTMVEMVVKYEELTFNLNAPKAHLPMFVYGLVESSSWIYEKCDVMLAVSGAELKKCLEPSGVSSLAQRIVTCEI